MAKTNGSWHNKQINATVFFHEKLAAHTKGRAHEPYLRSEINKMQISKSQWRYDWQWHYLLHCPGTKSQNLCDPSSLKPAIWAAQKQFVNTTKQIWILLAYYLILLTRFLTKKIAITTITNISAHLQMQLILVSHPQTGCATSIY